LSLNITKNTNLASSAANLTYIIEAYLLTQQQNADDLTDSLTVLNQVFSVLGAVSNVTNVSVSNFVAITTVFNRLLDQPVDAISALNEQFGFARK
jgi:hypothetical protein